MIRVITSVLFFAILAPPFAVAQLHEGFYDVELHVVPVAGRVHMIQRPDGFANVGVFVGEEGVLIFAHDNMRVRMLERRSRFPRGNGMANGTTNLVWTAVIRNPHFNRPLVADCSRRARMKLRGG